MRRTADPPVLEREQKSLEIGPNPQAIAEGGRRRSVASHRPAPRPTAEPEHHLYRTVMACSLDDEKV
jgi:hypothetical protein